MSSNPLLDALRANDKTGYLFETNSTFVAYKTGFPVLDYKMGFNVNVFGKDGKVQEVYPAIGITTGSIVTIIGRTHVGKSSIAIQIASNIVRQFKSGSVVHYDLEGGTNMTRISTLSKFTPTQLEDKYVLRQTGSSIEEIKKSIAKIYSEKISNPDTYMYDTGKLDEFGKPIVTYEPTCLIIDSVPSLSSYINENTKDGQKALEEITSQTDKMRMTAEIGRFLSESMQMMKAANIIMFLINHIKEKPPMGTPQAPEIRGMKQNETMPCGKALQYYSNTMIRLTSIGSEKYTIEEHGFDGFGVQALFIKNRSNTDGTIVPFVFDKGRGYDSVISSVMFAKSVDLLGGNRNGYYFIENKDSKFRLDHVREEFAANRELYKIMYAHIIPVLEHSLSSYKPEELIVCEEEMNY